MNTSHNTLDPSDGYVNCRTVAHGQLVLIDNRTYIIEGVTVNNLSGVTDIIITPLNFNDKSNYVHKGMYRLARDECLPTCKIYLYMNDELIFDQSFKEITKKGNVVTARPTRNYADILAATNIMDNKILDDEVYLGFCRISGKITLMKGYNAKSISVDVNRKDSVSFHSGFGFDVFCGDTFVERFGD